MALVHGQNPSGYLRPLLVDASGNIILSQPVQVKGTNADKLFSVGDNWIGDVGSSDLAAGGTIFDVYTVPADHTLRITHVNMIYVGTVATVDLALYFFTGGDNIYIKNIYVPTSGYWQNFTVDVYVAAGYALKYRVNNATLHDDSFCQVVGYLFHNT